MQQDCLPEAIERVPMDVDSVIHECISTKDIDTLGKRLDEMELQVRAFIPTEWTVAENQCEFESILTFLSIYAASRCIRE